MRHPTEYFSTVPPTARQLGIFHDAVRICKGLGIAFEPGAVHVRWFSRRHEPYLCAGYAWPHHRPAQVFIAADLPDGELFATLCHEFAHAHRGDTDDTWARAVEAAACARWREADASWRLIYAPGARAS